MQIKYYFNLYISKRLAAKKEKLIQKLEKNKLQPHIYLLTLAQGGQNQLEFFSTILLKQQAFEHTPLFVVGLAGGYDEALELVQEITEEVLSKTGNVNIRKYLLEQQEEYEKGGLKA